MTAEQWLADLEAKAAEASLAEKQGLVCGWWDIAEFREAVTPEAVLRLVAMGAGGNFSSHETACIARNES